MGRWDGWDGSPEPDRLTLSQRELIERQARDTVPVNKLATVFWESPLVGERGGVKATKCKLLSHYDGPDNAYLPDSRAVLLKTEERGDGRSPAYFTLDGRWPCWLVAVEGHAAPDDFPTEPQAFNEWFDRWLRKTGAKIICDYRKEAEADGALDWMRAGKPATDEPSEFKL